MAVSAKICGVTTVEAIAVAQRHGADFIGFILVQGSRRALSSDQVRELRAHVVPPTSAVVVMIDPDDDTLNDVVSATKPDFIQLHGAESPGRCAAIRRDFGTPVMKAVAVDRASDLDAARSYEGAVDRLLFDSKTADRGGSGVAFDWTLLRGRSFETPWFLSGGLATDNVGEAVAMSGARAVDVSSGVESKPGVKDLEKIAGFLDACSAL